MTAPRRRGSPTRWRKLNTERREIEQRMQAEAVELASAERLAEQGDALGVCLFDESWHQGVVGLVAGRIKDRLHRPVIAFARAEDGSLRGSARSIPGVNIRDALDAVATRRPGLIDKFGGHAMAAGMSLKAENLAVSQRVRARDRRARRYRVLERCHLLGRRAVRRGDVHRHGPGAARRRTLGTGISGARVRRSIPSCGDAHRRRSASEDAAQGHGRRRGGAGSARHRGDRLRLHRRRCGGCASSHPARRCSLRIGWKSTNTAATKACSSIASTCCGFDRAAMC
jgi:hypothetical protein